MPFLSECFLGETIKLYLDDNGFLVKRITNRTITATVFAISKAPEPNRPNWAPEYYLGWKEGEIIPVNAERRSPSMAMSLEYVADQELYTSRFCFGSNSSKTCNVVRGKHFFASI